MKTRLTLPMVSAAASLFMIVVLFLVSSTEFLGMSGRVRVGAGTRPADEKTYTIDELQEDFNRVRLVVESRHPMAFAVEEEVAEAFDRQFALLEDGMGELEFYRVLSPALAALNCGHSNVLHSRAYEHYVKSEAALLPLDVAVVQGRLHVVASRTAAAIPPGAEILSINGISSGEMLELIYRSVSSDGRNITRIHEMIENQFPFLYHSLIDESESFAIRYRTPGAVDAAFGLGEDAADGLPDAELVGSRAIRKTTITGLGFSELWGDNYRAASIGVLLDMAELRTNYAGRILDDHAVLSVGSFILDERAYESFLEDFFLELAEKNIEKLVVDLRGNWGGPPAPAALLLGYLSSEPVRYFNNEAPFYMFNYKRVRAPAEHPFAGAVSVLVDGSCFSTTAHLISLLKHHEIATLVGEETGGSASCIDGKRKLELPNTGLRVYYSTRVFTTAVEGFVTGRGIAPDHRITPTVEEIAAGSDPVAEFAAGLVGTGHAAGVVPGIVPGEVPGE